MMTSWRVLLLLVGVSCVSGLSDRIQKQLDGVPNSEREQLLRLDLFSTTEDFARKYGYPVETHTVTTDDGYLLTVHRIPGSPRAPSSGVKTPVLLQHGIGAASDSWLLMGPERGVGFILADEGYDVWMSNSRGNSYSRKHATLPPSDLTYNNYTWHEMGVYDLPAVIDHILMTTNHQQLFYIGHSMGTTMFFVLTTMRPEYNDKIRLAITMAPAVFLWRTRTSLKVLIPIMKQLSGGSTAGKLGALTYTLGVPYARMINALCSDGKLFQHACVAFYSSIFGYHEKEFNTTMLPTIMTHGVSFYSVPLLNHFSQLAVTGRFHVYDPSYRKLSRQPDYDLSKVTAPVSIMYANNDVVVTPPGVVHLSKRLPNLVNIVRIADDRANHNVFIFSIHIKELVMNNVLALMKKF